MYLLEEPVESVCLWIEQANEIQLAGNNNMFESQDSYQRLPVLNTVSLSPAS